MNRKTPRLRDWFTGKAYRTLFEQSEALRKAKDAYRSFEPVANVDYGWVLDAATARYRAIEDHRVQLDNKADSLIGYLGAGQGILALTLTYTVATGDAGGAMIWVIGPTLFVELLAMIWAAVVRAPATVPGAPAAGRALESIDKRPDEPRGKFAMRVEVACAAMLVVNDKKGQLLRRAYGLFLVGIAWFVLVSIVFGLFGRYIGCLVR